MPLSLQPVRPAGKGLSQRGAAISIPAKPDVPRRSLYAGLTALLLDRDGVINRELGHFVRSWAEFAFIPGTLEALRRLAVLPVPILVVSNQSAIGRGWTSAAVVADIHEHMLTAVRAAGGRIDDVLICPHAPEAGCACRKPRPGLLHEAALRYKFEARGALLVGDTARDVEAAQAVGARAVLVRSGHAVPPELEVRLGEQGVPVFADLAAVADDVAASRQQGHF